MLEHLAQRREVGADRLGDERLHVLEPEQVDVEVAGFAGRALQPAELAAKAGQLERRKHARKLALDRPRAPHGDP